MTREEAINHPECPDSIKERLAVVPVKFFGADNQIHEGQVVVDKDLTQDVMDLFEIIMKEKFPLTSVKPIAEFDWDDEASMSANNTSAFNYRKIAGQDRLSLHSYGFAIDLNPKINPVIEKGEVTQPSNGSYNTEVPGTLHKDHKIVQFMKSRGWEWGGHWERYQDYQHFQKKTYDYEKI